MFFTNEEARDTFWDFSKRTIKVLWFSYVFKIILI